MAVEVTIAKCVSLGHDGIFVVAELDRQGFQGTIVIATGSDVSVAVVI